MKIWRKWSYAIILLVCGIITMTVTDSWEAAAQPAQTATQKLVAMGEKYQSVLGTSVQGEPGNGGKTAGGDGVGIGEAAGGTEAGAGDGSGGTGAGIGEGGIGGNGAGIGEAAGGTGAGAGDGIGGNGAGAGGSTGGNGVGTGEAGTGANGVGAAGEAEVTWRDPSEVVYTTVEDDYFSDAVFIGDSRTVGMFEYGGLEETATFYASTGLTVYTLFDAKIIQVPGQREKITIEQALSENQFGKIYLMVGINEMGRGTLEGFLEQYALVIEHLKELQPDAVIYLQGIIKVTTERSNKGDYISNQGIEERNAGIAALADQVKVYYLDVNPVICDENGGMEKSYTTDGVHLMAQYIPIWKEFLKEHAVVLD